MPDPRAGMAIQDRKTFDREVQKQYPFIEWRKPIHISTPSRRGFGCRLCIAFEGWHAKDGTLFTKIEDFEEHMRETHEQHGD